ncbi:MAG: hypothetical protein IJ719_02795 [Clostridia bacterium]|nr:hypothetical protein [Clostridia bacterium]
MQRTQEQKEERRQIKIAFEILTLTMLLFLHVFLFGQTLNEEKVVVETFPYKYVDAYDDHLLHAADAQGFLETQYGQQHFAAIAYPTISSNPTGDQVSINTFRIQMEALRRSGYTSIMPIDAETFYELGAGLPEKAVMIILLDAAEESITQVEDILNGVGFSAVVCNYADEIGQDGILSAETLRRLQNTGRIRIGTRGYSRSYINAFDRYGNYLGNLSADEFDALEAYIDDDYEYAETDYVRDEDRIPSETESALRLRISNSYQKIKDVYQSILGTMPQMFVFTAPNTGAFGYVEVASRINGNNIREDYGINFNRQGTALNTIGSSAYDLSYIYVSGNQAVNHLMMRLWDDTGDDVMFSVGNETEAEKWMLVKGVAEFGNSNITLTSEPNGDATIALRGLMIDDCDLSVQLRGSAAGRQSVYLRTDRNTRAGIEVSIEDGSIYIREAGQTLETWFQSELPFMQATLSQEEEELRSRIAYAQAILENETDAVARAEAQNTINQLRRIKVNSISDGAEAAEVRYTSASRTNITLRIRLIGSELSVWINNVPIVSGLAVTSSGRGVVALGAGVTKGTYDAMDPADVADGIFEGLEITPVNAANSIYYTYTTRISTASKSVSETISSFVSNAVQRARNLFTLNR